MAFQIIIDRAGEKCDICRTLDSERPMLRQSVTGHTHKDRHFIWTHLDCFERRFARVKKNFEREEGAKKFDQRVMLG